MTASATDADLVAILSDRIARRVRFLMKHNNETVYVDYPVSVSYTRAERVTQAVVDAIVGKRLRIDGYVVTSVEIADMSKSAILVSLKRSPI